MQTRSTARYGTQSLSPWANAVVAATFCLSASQAQAERDVSRRLPQAGNPLSSTQSSRHTGRDLTLSLRNAGEQAYIYLGSEPTTFTTTARETSEQERTIALIRAWKQFKENWDDDGAHAPIRQSVEQASNFICALDEGLEMPEPTLHHNGRAGLFWTEDGLYGDLEFLENGHIAYYIEKGSDRHKGVVYFDGHKIPEIFTALLEV